MNASSFVIPHYLFIHSSSLHSYNAFISLNSSSLQNQMNAASFPFILMPYHMNSKAHFILLVFASTLLLFMIITLFRRNELTQPTAHPPTMNIQNNSTHRPQSTLLDFQIHARFIPRKDTGKVELQSYLNRSESQERSASSRSRCLKMSSR